MTKKALLLILTLFSTVFSTGLFAARFNVATGNREVSCKLCTYSQIKMLKRLGNLPAYFETTDIEHKKANISILQIALAAFFDINTGASNNGSTKIKQKRVNAFKTAVKRFQMVEVKITNNSSETIVLDRDEYLHGVTKALAPKEEILDLYPGFISYQKACMWGGAGILAGGGIASLPAGFIAAVCATKNQKLGALMSGAIALMCAGVAAYGGYSLYKAHDFISLAQVKRNNLLSMTSFGPEDESFKLAPGETFQDFFFIDLKIKKVDRDFIEDNLENIFLRSSIKK